MTDLSRERLAELHQGEDPLDLAFAEYLALLDMAEQLLALKSALGADAQTTTGFGGAMERKPDWAQFDPALHADKDRSVDARPLWTDDEDRLIDKAAAKALRELRHAILCGAQPIFSGSNLPVTERLRQRANELEGGG